MRILTDIRKYNPNVLFLLENVEMGAKWEKVLSEAIGVYGVHINSALVSAQNRKRIYWTNIRVKEVGLFGELHSDIPQPEDRGILLKDILEDEVDDKYYLSDKMLKWLDKHSEKRGVEVKKLDGEKKTGCLTATAQAKQNLTTDYVCISSTQKNATVTTDKSSPMTASMGYERTEIKSGTWRTHEDGRWFREIKSGKAACVPARAREDGSGQNVAQIEPRIRRLTPLECERLQTMKDNYTAVVSDTQRYKMIGNGWTIDVIAHIFSFIKDGKTR